VSEPAVDPRYVEARRVLLDALTALAPHGNAFIVAGAQAIYLRTGSADLDETIAPMTTDGDLALNPALLASDPRLEDAMRGAGFLPKLQDGGHVEPGIWMAPAPSLGSNAFVPVDLIVPDAVAGRGRRSADVGVHGDRVARRAVGLEAALIDHSAMAIVALDPRDRRSVEAEVAGVAALFVAKAHKIQDRVSSGHEDRVDDKDAADVVRLMQATYASEVAATFATLQATDVAGYATAKAVTYLSDLFGRRGRPGIEMAIRATRLAVPPERVEAICVAYVSELAARLNHS
jgi:hypothetical protein